MQYISRKGNFDSAHRVMNEKMKCFNLHGHTYIFELTFSFESIAQIGYAIDFKEIKRVACQWIDDALDHGVICNPKDELVIETARQLDSKRWLMSLNGEYEYCNPTVENIAKEIFLAMEILFFDGYNESGLKIHHIKLYETPNCWTDCDNDSINDIERANFRSHNGEMLFSYAQGVGIMNYDDRKKD